MYELSEKIKYIFRLTGSDTGRATRRFSCFFPFRFVKKGGLVKYGIASSCQFLYLALERRIHCSHACRL